MEIFNELLTRIKNVNKFIDINPKFICKHCLKDLNASFYLNANHVKKFIQYNNYVCQLNEPELVSDKIQQIYIKLVDLKHYQVKIEADEVKDKELFDFLSKIDYYQDFNRNVTNKNYENLHFYDTKYWTLKNSKLDANVTALKKPSYSTKQLHSCTICKSKFKNASNLNAHLFTHKYKHCCSTCGTWFMTKVELKKHAVIHKEVLYSCLICKKRFQTEMRRRQHMLRHIKNRSHSCSTCGRRFATERHLNIHSLTHHERDLIPLIERVNERSRTSPLNRKRIRKMNTLKMHICSTCKECFPSKYHLNRHSTKHSLHVCPQCEKIFKASHLLQSHMVCHSHEFKYLCSICGNRYKRIQDLNEHIARHDKNRYICGICGKSIKSKPGLLEHLRLHKKILRNERPFICATCGKCFNSKGDLKYHVATHLNLRHHKCMICEKSFNRKSDLKRHMLTHTKQNPHHCTICGRGFSQKSALKGHMLVHSDIKQYVCSDCGQPFKYKYNIKKHNCTRKNKKLNNHKKIHDKNYCRSCKLYFDNEAALENHNLVHTKERSLHCLICKKKFSRPDNLRKHLRVHVKKYSKSCKMCVKVLKHLAVDVRPADVTHILSCTRRNEKQILTNKTLHSCPKCEKQFKNKIIFNNHMKKHDNYYRPCKWYFDNEAALEKHKLVHSKECPQHCLACGKNFTSRGNLRKHLLIHVKEYSKSCKMCVKVLKSNNRYVGPTDVTHVFSHNNNSKATVEKHKLVQPKKRPHHCLLCGTNFIRRAHLRRHLIVHVKEYSKSCKMCVKVLKHRAVDVRPEDVTHVLSHEK